MNAHTARGAPAIRPRARARASVRASVRRKLLPCRFDEHAPNQRVPAGEDVT